jgi:signal transduction histidine kinase
MASVGTLAAGVAHEINNPLAYVSGNLSYLRDVLLQERLTAEDVADMREAAAEALEGTGRVRAIVQDLRTFSRSDEERFGPVEVHPVLEGALRLVRNELQHRAQLVRELSPVPTIQGNAVRLGQVVVNLLVNALQAFPERSPAGNRIRLATRAAEPGWVSVEVEDNGIGMEPEVQQHIFDPFFTTKPVGVGTGLGLAICHTIVEAMGGRIEVHSTPGQGSTFRLLLPVFREA